MFLDLNKIKNKRFKNNKFDSRDTDSRETCQDDTKAMTYSTIRKDQTQN
jgi:hypothetical protein